MDILSLFTAAVAGLFLFFTQVKGSESRFLYGVYAQAGKWYRLKYLAFLLLLQLRKLKSPKEQGEDSGMGVASRKSEKDMEKAQPLPDAKRHPNALDAVYFNAGDSNHNYMIAAASRRQNKLIQCLTIFKINQVGLLEHPQQPNSNFTTNYPEAFRKEDLHIQCSEPMKTWKIQFEGPMILKPENGGEKREVQVKAELIWEAIHATFDFDTDQDVHVLCSSVAKETWSKEFFEQLQGIHQTHYEQFGEVKGTITIDENVHNVCMQGARDHSYGNHRVWSDLYRYGLQYIYLEDTTCIAVGCVSMPKYLSNLIIGFVCKKDGRIVPLRQSDFVLHNLGQDGTPPQEFRITCLAGGEEYNVTCRVVDQSQFHMGGEQPEVLITERFCDYEVNGVKGWGVSEWCYNMGEKWPSWSNNN